MGSEMCIRDRDEEPSDQRMFDEFHFITLSINFVYFMAYAYYMLSSDVVCNNCVLRMKVQRQLLSWPEYLGIVLVAF